MKGRIVLVLGAIAVIVLASVLSHGFVSLDDLKRHFAFIAGFRERAPVTTVMALFVGYVLVAVLPLPFASILTIAAGAIFGFVDGTIIASFASSIAAFGAFLASRYFFRAGVQLRYGYRLEAVNRGIARDGGFYLFTLRLIPVFPYFLVNLLMGLSPIKARTFYWVSQVGMLPIAIVYVNAGTQLARLRHAGDVLSLGLLMSFALLALFPWMAKFAVEIWRRRTT